MPSSGQSIKDISSEYENLPKQERDRSEIEDKYIDAVSEAMDLINADLRQTRLKNYYCIMDYQLNLQVISIP
jgi:hypothetical protein